MSQYRCGFCRGVGHNSRTCVKLKVKLAVQTGTLAGNLMPDDWPQIGTAAFAVNVHPNGGGV